MNILAIETSTEACSAALMFEDTVCCRFEIAPRRHTDLVLPMIDEVLNEAAKTKKDIDAVSFGNGPGAFTGIRIATAIAQGLAFSLDVPVVPVSTLAAMAQRAIDNHSVDKVLIALDARMGEVYWAAYIRDDNGYAKEVIAPIVTSPADILFLEGNNWIGAGNGWGIYADDLSETVLLGTDSVIAGIYPGAKEIAVLARQKILKNEVTTIESALPMYLRNNVVQSN